MLQILKRYNRYVLPTMLAMIISSMYIVVDGIIVGQGIGTDALAAVNLTTPIYTLMIAISTMLALGGGTRSQFEITNKNKIKANEYFNSTVFGAVILLAAFSSICIFAAEPLLLMMGSTKELLKESSSYLRTLSVFTIFFSMEIVLAAFLRNNKLP